MIRKIICKFYLLFRIFPYLAKGTRLFARESYSLLLATILLACPTFMGLPLHGEGTAKNGMVVNSIRFIVGDVAITEMDITSMESRLLHMKRGRVRGKSIRTQAIDELISRAIVEMVAREESIIVSDARIDNELRKRMQMTGIEDESKFHAAVERETGMSFEDWVDDMRYEIKKRQVIQIKVNVPLPDEQEIRKFYNANRSQIGFEVSYREIILKPRNKQIPEEKRVSDLAARIVAEVNRNPARFDILARTTPENISPLKSAGGLQTFIPLQEIASQNPILAGILFNQAPGRRATTFRDPLGRYVIVRTEARRPVSLDRVQEMIRQRIYFEKEEKAFDEWMEKRKKEVVIKEIKS